MSMRILFLTPQLPYPPHQGTILRNYGLIEGLARRGHHIALVTFVEPDQPTLQHTPLKDLCVPAVAIPAPTRTLKDRLRDLFHGHADLAGRRWSEDFRDRLRQVLTSATFDVVHIEGFEMSPYLDTIRQYAPGAAIVYDAHNAEHALQRRIAQQDFALGTRLLHGGFSWIQATRLTVSEGLLCASADLILACSGTDAEHLSKLGHDTPIVVVPNAIDVDSYRVAGQEVAPVIHPSLLFTGKMDFRPNVDAMLWFANEILPLIREQVPEAHLCVVGQKPHARLNVLQGHPGVTLTGFVPDIRPYLRAADVYIAPLRMGSGTRFKLLEAMAMSRAVVSTTVGAEGLAITSSYDMLLADTAEDFARAVFQILANESRRLELGFNAARLVRDTYTWDAIIPQVELAYERFLKGRVRAVRAGETDAR